MAHGLTVLGHVSGVAGRGGIEPHLLLPLGEVVERDERCAVLLVA